MVQKYVIVPIGIGNPVVVVGIERNHTWLYLAESSGFPNKMLSRSVRFWILKASWKNNIKEMHTAPSVLQEPKQANVWMRTREQTCVACLSKALGMVGF